MDKKIFWFIPIFAVMAIWFLVESLNESDEEKMLHATPTPAAPDFTAITDTNEKKEAFFNYLVPFVIEKNTRLLADREKLTQIINSQEPPSREDKKWLAALREIFKLKKVSVYTRENLEQLYLNLDIIPESLVVAQAANESAWGTSRFAVEGNNYFGQWCFRKGCGLVPEARDDEASHEVRRFRDAKESVFVYMDNLNSNPAYKVLRKRRAQLRAEGKEITGLELAHGLLPYSQRREEYVKEISLLIRSNKLWRFNENYLVLESDKIDN